jgi:hypothetical protein
MEPLNPSEPSPQENTSGHSKEVHLAHLSEDYLPKLSGKTLLVKNLELQKQFQFPQQLFQELRAVYDETESRKQRHRYYRNLIRSIIAQSVKIPPPGKAAGA